MAKQYLLHRVGHFGDNESVEGRILLFAFFADALCLPFVKLLLHAVNLYLRWPDIFCGCLALSGIYTAHYGFGDYMDELVYMNSPVDYMRNFPEDHPYMELYRNQKAVICCGQGAWEQPDTTWYLKRIFEAKGIPVWVDLWGHDVKHDWDWWYKQTVYYMPYILG